MDKLIIAVGETEAKLAKLPKPEPGHVWVNKCAKYEQMPIDEAKPYIEEKKVVSTFRSEIMRIENYVNTTFPANYDCYEQYISSIKLPSQLLKWRVKDGKWQLLTDFQIKQERKMSKKSKSKPVHRRLKERAKHNSKAARILKEMQIHGTHK